MGDCRWCQASQPQPYMCALKQSLPLIIISLLLVCSSCEPSAPSLPQQSELAVRIGWALPQNWRLEESKDQIIIARKEPVRSHGCIGLDLSWLRHPELLQEHVEKYGVTSDYKIRLRIAPRMDLSEYARLDEVNSQIRVTKSTMISNREYFEADAMSSFDPRYRELPDYYDKDSSIYLGTTLHPWECIYPGDVARECKSVLQALDAIFPRYPGSRSRGALSWMD